MAIYQLGEDTPVIDASAYVADSANVIGKVSLGANASVWFGSTIRGDNDDIVIGDNSNVQENCVLHTDPGYPLTVGDNVTIGHQVMLHGCSIGDGKEFPDNSLIIGTPAKAVRTLSDDDVARIGLGAKSYIERAAHFKANLKRVA